MIEQVMVETDASLFAVRQALRNKGCDVEESGTEGPLLVTVHEPRNAEEEVTEALNNASIAAFVYAIPKPTAPLDETLIQIDARQLESRTAPTIARVEVKRKDGKIARLWLSIHLEYNGRIKATLTAQRGSGETRKSVSPNWRG